MQSLPSHRQQFELTQAKPFVCKFVSDGVSQGRKLQHFNFKRATMLSETIDDDPYFQQLVPAGEIAFSRHDTHQLYLQVHTSDESYSDKWERELGIELSVPRGVRQYIHTKPCILIPRITLAVAASESAEFATMSSANTLGTSIGKVVRSEVQGMERRAIGNGQAWFYPSDNILVLWGVRDLSCLRCQIP